MLLTEFRKGLWHIKMTFFFYMTCPSLSLSLTDHLHGLGWWEGAGLRSGPNVFTKVPRSEGFLPFQVFSASCTFHLFYTTINPLRLNWCRSTHLILMYCRGGKPRPCWKTRLARSHLCRIDLPLDGWRSLDLCTFCQPFKWLWHEEGIGTMALEMWRDW